MMYNEHAFLDRFAAAAADGFKGVEFLFPYEHPAEEVGERCAPHQLEGAVRIRDPLAPHGQVREAEHCRNSRTEPAIRALLADPEHEVRLLA